MKTLYMIGGTMGVGKTTLCRELKKVLPDSVFLDGDWCWDADPFYVTEETRAMVLDNICYLLNSFLRCSVYQNVIFCWVMHEQATWDTILRRLHTENCSTRCIALTADEAAVRGRLEKDIAAGLRSADVVERSIARLSCYQDLKAELMDTSAMSADDIARKIVSNR